MGGGNENAVIAGNGPSLAKIDYNRLPEHFDVFRCNQFYFEDSYFLGKEVKYAFFNPFLFFEQYYTLSSLNYNKEYEIENIICSTFNNPAIDDVYKLSILKNLFSEVWMGGDILNRLDGFCPVLHFNELYHQKRITSGVYMCACATALGYKKIYLTGIDLYSSGSVYAFDSKRENLIKVLPEIKKDDSVYGFHSSDYDIFVLNMLVEKYGVEIYSLSSESPISQHFHLAPLLEKKSDFKIEKKSENAIRDLLLPNKNAYEVFNNAMINTDRGILNHYFTLLVNYNIFYRFSNTTIGKKIRSIIRKVKNINLKIT